VSRYRGPEDEKLYQATLVSSSWKPKYGGLLSFNAPESWTATLTWTEVNDGEPTSLHAIFSDLAGQYERSPMAKQSSLFSTKRLKSRNFPPFFEDKTFQFIREQSSWHGPPKDNSQTHESLQASVLKQLLENSGELG
jgi:hypothetical protein